MRRSSAISVDMLLGKNPNPGLGIGDGERLMRPQPIPRPGDVDGNCSWAPICCALDLVSAPSVAVLDEGDPWGCSSWLGSEKLGSSQLMGLKSLGLWQSFNDTWSGF